MENDNVRIINDCEVFGHFEQLDSLTKVMEAFHQMLKLPIYVTISSFPTACSISVPVKSQRNKERALFCTQLHQCPRANEQCKLNDKTFHAECRKTGERVLRPCWAGIYEMIMPIKYNDEVIGTLSFGQFLKSSPTEQALRETEERLRRSEISVDIAGLRENYFALRVLTDETIEMMNGLISVIFREIISAIEQSRASRSRYLDLLSTLEDNSAPSLVGISGEIESVRRQVLQLRDSDVSVLIRGESGTGKELVARMIHSLSMRSNKPFVIQNCAAIPETLIESELFGHKRGAFTDAKTDKVGLFELANDGTLFLDEIGNMPISMQLKILRVLEDGVVKRVGDASPVSVNFRLITATNSDLETEIARGTFRKDLYYRINTIEIVIPPLRKRREDIPALCRHFLDLFCKQYGKEPFDFEPAALNALEQYPWPGNVRELKNEMHRLAIMTIPGGTIRKEDVSNKIAADLFLYKAAHPDFDEGESDDIPPLNGILDARERELLLEALAKSKGNKSVAAKIFGCSRRGFYKKLEKYDIQ